MRRRRNHGFIIDLFEVVAKLPWWVGVTLAVIAYVVLHFYATESKSLASVGQYLLPIVFLAGAAASAVARQAKESLTMPPRIEPYLGAGEPACPRCSRPMLERIAQQGSNAGKSFWGCPAFPDCRGTLPIG